MFSFFFRLQLLQGMIQKQYLKIFMIQKNKILKKDFYQNNTGSVFWYKSTEKEEEYFKISKEMKQRYV